MEATIDLISLTLIIVLIICPVIIIWTLNRNKIRFKFLKYLIICSCIAAIVVLVYGWWVDYSNNKLLEHYGYNIDAINDNERFANVSFENMERVKSLEKSIMGIGWPLKVMINYILYSPYLLIVYLVNFFLGQKNRKSIKS